MLESRNGGMGVSIRPDQWARRRFIAALAGLLAAPLAAEGQQAGKVYRLGFLGMASAVQFARQVDGMRQGLRELGYIEGQNLNIEYRWADGKYVFTASLRSW